MARPRSESHCVCSLPNELIAGTKQQHQTFPGSLTREKGLVRAPDCTLHLLVVFFFRRKEEEENNAWNKASKSRKKKKTGL